MSNDKIIRKNNLYEQLKKKRDKILKISALLCRNQHDYNAMKKEYEKLDRDIFIETHGIKKVSIKSIRQENTICLTEAFIEGLSSEAREKLIARLRLKIELAEIEKNQKSLQEVS